MNVHIKLTNGRWGVLSQRPFGVQIFPGPRNRRYVYLAHQWCKERNRKEGRL